MYDTTGQPLTTHQWCDGTQHPWEFKRVWHVGADMLLNDPDTCYAGVEDAGLFKTTNGGTTWQEVPGLRGAKGEKWSPGAGGLCLHTIVLDPKDPDRITIAISAAGCFRTDDGGKTWKPINKGLRNDYLPDPRPEIGICVHHLAMNPVPSQHAVHAVASGWRRLSLRQRRRFVAGGQRKFAHRFRFPHRRARP